MRGKSFSVKRKEDKVRACEMAEFELKEDRRKHKSWFHHHTFVYWKKVKRSDKHISVNRVHINGKLK